MKTLNIFLLLLFLSLRALAQLSGKVTDARGEGVPFVNILLLNAVDSSLTKGAITDDAGAYRLANIAAGEYLLRLSAVGFQPYTSSAFTLTPQESKSLGIQVMEEDTQQLEEVVVHAEKPLYQQETDRTVINVESSVMTQGSSALQVLERSPGVMIDYQNGGISLNGKTGVMVMLNGKLMRLPPAEVVNLLNGMSADHIEKIELLTTPPARYDAEGSGGMINIVTKQSEEEGPTGSFSATGGYGWGEKAASSINLVHHSGNASVYGSYSFLHDRTYHDVYLIGSQNVPALGGALNIHFWNTTKPVSNNHNATVGTDIRLKKTTLGGSMAYNNSLVTSDVFNRGEYTIMPDSFLLIRVNRQETNRWNNINTNLYLEKQLGEGERLNTSVDYLYYQNENPSEIYNTFSDNKDNRFAPEAGVLFTRLQGRATTSIQVGVGKVDYTHQLNDQLLLATGVKGTYTRSSSFSTIERRINDEWVGWLSASNDIAMQEAIGAAYSSLDWQINPSAKLTLGARYEYSHTRTDATKEENRVNRRLGKLFPSLFFSKNINNDASLDLSYTKRISRPTYNDLASYLIYSDPISAFTGNPLLKPTITNNLKIGYHYQGYSFSVLLSRDDHPIVRYQLTESPAGDLLYVSPQNVAYQNNLTFQADVPWKVNHWWSTNQGVIGGWRQFKLTHTPTPVVKTYFTYSVYGNHTFGLPKRFFIEISGFYNSLSYNGSIKVDGFGSINAGIKKELKDDRGTLQLAVSDLFKTMNIHSYFGTLTEEAFAINNHVSFNTESRNARIIKLTYSKSFGNNKIKRGRQDKSAEEERSRVREN